MWTSGGWLARATGIALGVSVVALGWMLGGGPPGVGYLLLFVLATLPGWPLGVALFGARQPAAWILGGALGYGLTAIALSIAIRFGARSPSALLTAWAALAALTALALRLPRPQIPLAPWTRRDAAALLLLLLLVPLLFGLVFRHVGVRDEAGNRYYRAYFTADYLWHVALTAELGRFTLPPSNPYMADRPLHYYWTYFIVPAAAAAAAGTGGQTVEHAVTLNALCAGLLFIATIWIATWIAVPHAVAASIAVALALLASSVEGLYGIAYLLARGRPLSGLRHLNIDALTSWLFQGLRVDGLQRSLWYVPQHGMACALGLVALTIAAGRGARASLPAILAAGLAIGASVVFSPLVGAAFALIYGISVTLDAVANREAVLRTVARHTWSVLPVVAALVWCASVQMFEGGASSLSLGLAGPARHAPLITLALSFGPLLLPALAGLWRMRELPRTIVPALVGVATGLFLMYFVLLVPDQFWVGFRAGQILLITLPALAARFFAEWLRVRRLRPLAFGIATLLLALGLPTTVIDAYNAQDIDNRAMGPGFRWTIAVTPQEQAAFEWIKRATPRDAIVQMEPTVRGRETWTLIPTFAERRMAAGLPISLLWSVEYGRRSARVRRLFESHSAAEAFQAARELRIDYLYVDAVERQAYPGVLEKFDAKPQYFTAVFRNDEVVVYGVRRN